MLAETKKTSLVQVIIERDYLPINKRDKCKLIWNSKLIHRFLSIAIAPKLFMGLQTFNKFILGNQIAINRGNI